MLVIGLTGGIASGKTAVANLFTEFGITIIDTDKIAHQLVEPGKAPYQKIIDKFGSEILHKNSQLNRPALRERIFANPDDKQWLESLLHPLIREITAFQIEQANSDYCIVVIPLLYETWPNPLLDRVLVIESNPDIQLQRLLLRDDISKTLAHSMIKQQASNAQRLSLADDVIKNEADLDQLLTDVSKMHYKYQQILNNAL